MPWPRATLTNRAVAHSPEATKPTAVDHLQTCTKKSIPIPTNLILLNCITVGNQHRIRQPPTPTSPNQHFPNFRTLAGASIIHNASVVQPSICRRVAHSLLHIFREIFGAEHDHCHDRSRPLPLSRSLTTALKCFHKAASASFSSSSRSLFLNLALVLDHDMVSPSMAMRARSASWQMCELSIDMVWWGVH